MPDRLVAANWKMHGSLAANAGLLAALANALGGPRDFEVAVCVPFPYLSQAVAALSGSGVHTGAQNLHAADAGAFTGEVSGSMLRDVGAAYVIVGHSERRSYCGENDAAIVQKWQAARRHGLVPIYCVGETLAEREAGQAMAVLARQLGALLTATGGRIEGSVLAYEPVWAIGTGHSATAQQAQEIHAFLRSLVARENAAAAARLPILYGGSVKAENAAALFAEPDIDGGLVGGASLDAGEFLEICRAAARRPV